VVINARCSLRVEADQRVIIVGRLPVHYYRAEDAVARLAWPETAAAGVPCDDADDSALSATDRAGDAIRAAVWGLRET
jgi:hypothetical protein